MGVCQPHSRYSQIQYTSIKKNDDIKLSSAYIRKMQNTTDIGILVSTEAAVDRRKLDISDKNEVQK